LRQKDKNSKTLSETKTNNTKLSHLASTIWLPGSKSVNKQSPSTKDNHKISRINSLSSSSPTSNINKNSKISIRKD